MVINTTQEDLRAITALQSNNLLSHNREHVYINPVELIKAGPGPSAGETLEDLPHGHEIQLVRAVEHYTMALARSYEGGMGKGGKAKGRRRVRGREGGIARERVGREGGREGGRGREREGRRKGRRKEEGDGERGESEGRRA
jgi:hypothetical protein